MYPRVHSGFSRPRALFSRRSRQFFNSFSGEDEAIDSPAALLSICPVGPNKALLSDHDAVDSRRQESQILVRVQEQIHVETCGGEL